MLLAIVLAPLAAAIVAGLFGRWIGRAATHTITILGVATSFVLSTMVLWDSAAWRARLSTARSIPGS